MPIDRPVRLAVALLLSLAAVREAAADEPYVVRDFEGRSGPALGSDPSFLPTTGDAILFRADTEEHGSELWTTDGTPGGTRIFLDLCPGPCSSAPSPIGRAGERLLLEGSSPQGGFVWSTDGTWEGTIGIGRLPRFYEVGELPSRELFFYQGPNRGLWVTDGRPGSARPLGLGGPDGPPDFANGLGAGDPRMVFSARHPDHGFEPWVTDGTDAGTRMLGDLAPGPADSIRAFDGVVDYLFFGLPAATVFFSHAGGCVALWRTDGTPAGTQKVLEMPGCGYPMVSSEVAGGAVYFVAPDESGVRQLWRSDGTAPGTRPQTFFGGTPFGTGSSLPGGMEPFGDGVAVGPDDGVHGREPWIADASGARLLADICPGPCSSFGVVQAKIDGYYYLLADDGVHGRELWRTDGTVAGTHLVHDACPGACSSHTDVIGAAGGRVFFRASADGVGFYEELWAVPPSGAAAVRVLSLTPLEFVGSSQATAGTLLLFNAFTEEHGNELWVSDGTPEGTRMLVELRFGREFYGGGFPHLITPWLDGVFFIADDGGGPQPWRSDGTEAGTRKLGEVVPGAPSFTFPYAEPAIAGGRVLFLARPTDGETTELWSAAGTGAPVRLLGLDVREAALLGSAIVPLGDEAIFLPAGFDPGGVWATDGTAGGTRLLRELRVPPPPEGAQAAVLAGEVLFTASDPLAETDFELWKTDGTAAGTVQVADLAPDHGSFPTDFVAFGGLVLFSANGADSGRELWRSDGTAAGTALVADLVPGPDGSDPTGLVRAGSRVFFVAQDGLWVTDGTPGGTLPLPVFAPLRPIPGPGTAAAGSRLFFLAHDGLFNRLELWVSDGTPAGTRSLEHLWPEDARVEQIWPDGDRLLAWIANPGIAGLWETDGTFAGTHRIVSASSVREVGEPSRSGPLLFFRGDHVAAGQELMALRTGPSEPCAAGAETLCLRDGRFAVRARWRDPRSGDQGTAGALPMPGSDRTGLFWFFQPDNVELVFKTLDGEGVNGYFWNFYGGLSDVAYTIEVTDTATGRRVEYHNPEGEICGRGDTAAFPARPAEPAPAAAPVRRTASPGSGTACGGDPGDLCLFGGRFRVEVAWADQRSGDSGVGTAIPFADRSGFFWFFEPQNVELVVKILDGTAVNGRFWVFYGGLSDVEHTITVTDTETQEQAVYHNAQGDICGRGDTAAF